MSILAIDQQRRMRRLGEIRLGTKGPKGQPVKLDTFRLTSIDHELIRDAAEAFGGTPERWQDTKWQVITETAEIDVLIPPQNPDNVQWMEEWGAGGLKRRCDTETQIDGNPCVCDLQDPTCTPHTRVSLMIPGLRDIGVWKLESTGWSAAHELGGAVVMLMRELASTGWLPEASLRMEHREIKKQGQPVNRFVVPVLRLPHKLSELLHGAQHHLPQDDAVASLGQGEGEEQSSGEKTAVLIAGEAAREQTGSSSSPPDSTEPPDLDDEEPPDLELVDASTDLAWIDLDALLSEDFTLGTKIEIRERGNHLYALMTKVGLWDHTTRDEHIGRYLAKNKIVPKVADELHWSDLPDKKAWQVFAEYAAVLAKREVKLHG